MILCCMIIGGIIYFIMSYCVVYVCGVRNQIQCVAQMLYNWALSQAHTVLLMVFLNLSKYLWYQTSVIIGLWCVSFYIVLSALIIMSTNFSYSLSYCCSFSLFHLLLSLPSLPLHFLYSPSPLILSYHHFFLSISLFLSLFTSIFLLWLVHIWSTLWLHSL